MQQFQLMENLSQKMVIQNYRLQSDLKRVHKLRSQVDAILVGKNTVLKDNPLLTVRNVKGKNPLE